MKVINKHRYGGRCGRLENVKVGGVMKDVCVAQILLNI